MAAEDCEQLLKIIVIGDSSVGKSSLTVRLSEDVFFNQQLCTLPLDMRMYSMPVLNKKIKLNIWDTAGHERFLTITTSYYRGSNGVLLCFDVTQRHTFEHLDAWLARVEANALPGTPCVLVGCKCDAALASNRQVSQKEAVHWAKQHKMQYIETSAKENVNVHHVFEQLALLILQSAFVSQPAPAAKQTIVKLDKEDTKNESAPESSTSCPC